MIKEGKFGVQEAISLATISITAKVFFTSPGILARIVGTSSWYMTLVSMGVSLIGFTFIYLALKKFPGKNIIEVFEIVMGPYIGFGFSALLSAAFMFEAATLMREFTEVMRIYIFTTSPPGYILTFFVLAVAVLTFLGLETIARVARLSAFALLSGFIILLVLAVQNYEVHRLFPIFGYGLEKTLVHGVTRSSAYGDIIMLAVFAGSLQGSTHLKKAGYTSLLLSGFLVSVSILAYSLTFPYYTASEITSPMYEMASLIDYGRYVQRLEPIFLFIWNISTLISITAFFYASTSIYCKMFRLQDIRPVIIPMCSAAFALAMLPKDFTTIATGYVQNIREFGWAAFYLPAAITFSVGIIRRKGGASSDA